MRSEEDDDDEGFEGAGAGEVNIMILHLSSDITWFR